MNLLAIAVLVLTGFRAVFAVASLFTGNPSYDVAHGILGIMLMFVAVLLALAVINRKGS